MTEIFTPELSSEKMHKLSTLSLAHIGDAVFELLVRTWLIEQGITTSNMLHKETISRVSAGAQAKFIERLLPRLSESELAVFKRGRNSKPGSRPVSASPEDYMKATGLEALFGHLYLSGSHERIGELFDIVFA